jgi:8-oxo-dGTP pyrophosphatase MutT (NUDIX family)
MSHIHYDIDFTVEVFIVHKNRVLLRKHDKYKKWLSVGGHIDLREDPGEAAIREVKEEVGLDVELIGEKISYPSDGSTELLPPMFLNRHTISGDHEHVTLAYFGKSNTDRIIQSEQEKSEECRWFTYDELDDESYGIGEKIRAYAKKALGACK